MSHLLGGLLQYPFILDPVLQRTDWNTNVSMDRLAQSSCTTETMKWKKKKDKSNVQLGTALISGGTPGNRIDRSLQSQLREKGKKHDMTFCIKHKKKLIFFLHLQDGVAASGKPQCSMTRMTNFRVGKGRRLLWKGIASVSDNATVQNPVLASACLLAVLATMPAMPAIVTAQKLQLPSSANRPQPQPQIFKSCKKNALKF